MGAHWWVLVRAPSAGTYHLTAPCSPGVPGPVYRGIHLTCKGRAKLRLILNPCNAKRAGERCSAPRPLAYSTVPLRGGLRRLALLMRLSLFGRLRYGFISRGSLLCGLGGLGRLSCLLRRLHLLLSVAYQRDSLGV